MKKILLIYTPVCTPASMPYSITNLYSFLKANGADDVKALDLNAKFHSMRFPEYKNYIRNMRYNKEEYNKKTREFIKKSAEVYSENNKKVIRGEKPELFDELMQIIKKEKPDITAFSLVYSSQVFYAYPMIKELNNEGIITIAGGPAVSRKIMGAANYILKDRDELLKFLGKEKKEDSYALDFSIYDDEYFTPESVVPIKTSNTCYYRRCAFCSHYAKEKYFEFPLGDVKKTIKDSGKKHFFLADEMISKKRLLQIADFIRDLNVRWTCQLKPTKEYDYDTLKKLNESGLKMVEWGVESGNERVLKLMKKGTNVKDVEKVLEDSHKAGIKNVVYIMFGFPTETKEEFINTIDFLKRNSENIDLVSTTIFGLQKGTDVFENPSVYGIKKIYEEERTVLDPKISYDAAYGLTNDEARELRQKYKKTIDKINRYPKDMNFFREHMLILS